MFQEDKIYSVVDELIKNKFPNSVKLQNEYISFTEVKEEYLALRSGVGVRLVFGANIIQMTGKDVLDFLQRISTNDVSKLQPFNSQNTLFLNEKGRFIDRTTLISLEDEFILISNPDPDKKLLSWINKYIIMEDIVTTDLSEKYFLLELIGSQVNSFLTMLIGNEITSISSNNVMKFFVDGFIFHVFLSEEKNGIKIYEILIDQEKLGSFLEYLLNNKSVFDLELVGNVAYSAFRIKNKIPTFPNEINDTTNPHETELMGEVSIAKGCYIGQEVIARLETYEKIKRKMSIVTFDEQIDFDKTMAIFDHQLSEAGALTSYSNAAFFENPLGLALINKKSLEQKENLFIQSGTKKIRLKVLE
jgi:tRNA-modifying protein YgfZ